MLFAAVIMLVALVARHRCSPPSSCGRWASWPPAPAPSAPASWTPVSASSARDELGDAGHRPSTPWPRASSSRPTELRRESTDQYRKLFETMTESFFTRRDPASMRRDSQSTGSTWRPTRSSRRRPAPARRGRQAPQRDPAGCRPSAGCELFGSVCADRRAGAVRDRNPRALGRHFNVRAYRVGRRRTAAAWPCLFNDVTERKQAEQPPAGAAGKPEPAAADHARHRRAAGPAQHLPGGGAQRSRSSCRWTSAASACYEAEHERLLVACIGERSQELAQADGHCSEQAHIADRPERPVALRARPPGLRTGCRRSAVPVPAAAGGAAACASMVAAPLLVESRCSAC